MSEDQPPEWVGVPFRFGELNDVRPPMIGPRESNLGKQSFFSNVLNVVRDWYAVDALAGTGPYIGIVLRDETDNIPQQGGEEQTEGKVNPPDPLLGWAGTAALAAAPLTKLRVRIPEVHAALPMPPETGDTEDPLSLQMIEMYDVFTAQSTGPEYKRCPAGTLVWIDYKNHQNWTDPIFLGLVDCGEGTDGGATQKPPNSKDKSNDACKKKYKRKPGSGDSFAGENKNLEPYQGLPRLKRATGQVLDDWLASAYKIGEDRDGGLGLTVDESAPYNEKVLKQIKKAFIATSDWKLISWYGHLPSNGSKDEKHTPNQRSTFIAVPAYFDPTQDWEMIYWFHGLTGFKQKNFEKRYFPQINKLCEDNRNFVFVVPELPWSEDGTGESRDKLAYRQRLAWNPSKKAGGDFVKFHQEDIPSALAVILKQRIEDTSAKPLIAPPIGSTALATGDPIKIPPPAFVSIYGHSCGGAAIARAAMSGALLVVKPDRIFFSDSDYGWFGGAVKKTWNEYINHSDNKKRIWLTMLTMKSTRSDGGPRKKALTFMKGLTGDDKKKHDVYHIIEDKHSHAWCGRNALTMTHPDHFAKQEAYAKAQALAEEKEKQKEKEKSPDEATAQAEAEIEEQGVENEANEKTATKEKDESSKTPPVKSETEKADPPEQGPPAPASKNPKASETEDPPKPDFTLHPAVKYSQNRVKFKDYGGALAPDSPHLVDIGYGKKAHVLVASRWNKMREAMIKDGLTEEGDGSKNSKLRIHSAWRKHKWKNDYNFYLNYIKEAKTSSGAKKYATIKEGKGAIAFQSPHETGLAIDILGWGIPATDTGGAGKKAKEAQLQKHLNTKLGKWLAEHAHEYGFTPYKKEAWHYECKIPISAWVSGKEYTDDFAVRTDDMGKATKVPGSSQTGKSKTTSTAPCVIVKGGKTGPLKDNAALTLSPNAKVAGPAIEAGPAPQHIADKGENNLWTDLVKFCVHETAGWPSNIGQRHQKQGKTTCGITFWTMADGITMQTQHPATKIWHCQAGAWYSTGTEMANMGPMHSSKYWGSGAKWVQQGTHILGRPVSKGVLTTKGNYDIEGYPGYKGAAMWMIPRPKQCEAVWQLIWTLHSNPPSTKDLKAKKQGGGYVQPKIAIPIAFPAVDPALGIFTYDSWAGEPIKFNSANRQRIGQWWTERKKTAQGIFCHWDCGFHGDGKFGVYYCMGRAMNLSPANAFYAAVGAACSIKTDGKGGVPKGIRYSPLPKDGMVKAGKAKYPWPLNAGHVVDIPYGRTWHYFKPKSKAAKEWAATKAANPKWIGDVLNPT
jgi:hypothetical protein